MTLIIAASCCIAILFVGLRYARCGYPRDEIAQWTRNRAAVGRLGPDDPAAVVTAEAWCRVLSTATIPKQREHRESLTDASTPVLVGPIEPN